MNEALVTYLKYKRVDDLRFADMRRLDAVDEINDPDGKRPVRCKAAVKDARILAARSGAAYLAWKHHELSGKDRFELLLAAGHSGSAIVANGAEKKREEVAQ